MTDTFVLYLKENSSHIQTNFTSDQAGIPVFHTCQNTNKDNLCADGFLSHALIRQLSTIDTEYVKIKQIIEVIEVFIQEMKSSGYNREQTRETVIGGIKGWKRKIKMRETEGIGFRRLAKDTLGSLRKKLGSKAQ